MVRVDFGCMIITLWDLGGETGLRTLWTTYLDECQAAIFLIDSSCPARYFVIFCFIQCLVINKVAYLHFLTFRFNEVVEALGLIDKIGMAVRGHACFV